MKVMVFYPHPFYPPRSGTHRRCLEMLAGLSLIGCSVTVATTGTWHDADKAVLQASPYRVNLEVFEPNHKELTRLGRLHKIANLVGKKIPTSWAYRASDLPGWFEQLAQKVSPDAILINYADSDVIFNHALHTKQQQIIETHDLVTLNRKMWGSVEALLPPAPIRVTEVPDELLALDFFEQKAFVPDPMECAVYNRYHVTIAIAEQEAGYIRQHARDTQVVVIPMTQTLAVGDNEYTGNAVLPTGPNPFNTQGVLWFFRHALPRIRQAVPDFLLQVTGTATERVQMEPGAEAAAFFPHIRDLYRPARFMVCPIFGGTGQQVKIVEAMAHGVPVVALRNAAQRSPIVDGENGLIADTAEEFAEAVVRLWKDVALCKRLGNGARATIREQHSTEQLGQMLQSILQRSQ